MHRHDLLYYVLNVAFKLANLIMPSKDYEAGLATGSLSRV